MDDTTYMALPEVAVNNQNSTAKTEVSIDLPLTDDLRYILGRQSYTCASQATVLRMLGYQIAESAADEQAATLHWMLVHYMKDPANWRSNVKEEYESAIERLGRPGS
ncbi:hypothetical protein YA0697_14360 [Pseudomonas viridiflava]|uniref:hypothetical protein n=1 Tax=Pseudomonas viridiflava TaxID=33069 RepID=UPI0018E5E570|nr:hypothetical protein [Pseudomonas viridiflava]MBI6682897.1 hypothetical protein [Pseudomonas viridiflava]